VTTRLPLGLGTGKVDDRETCIGMVSRALAAGYRHIDTAQGYENEAYVGEALADSDVDRGDVLVATKVLQHNLGYDDVLATVDRSLARLGVDAVDVLYVHWPTHEYDPERTLAAFDELYDRGLAARLGVCNFRYDQLVAARDLLDAPLSVYQVEYHPLFRPTGLVDYCQDHGIGVVGYSPLADGRALGHPVVRSVARTCDATPAQVCLGWALAHDVTPIPKGRGAHLEENLAARAIELPASALARLDAITDEATHRVYDPPWAPWR
jgi:2,5-diketo-D-gluconate reductase B